MSLKARIVRITHLIGQQKKKTFMILSSLSEKMTVASAAVAMFPEEFGFRPLFAHAVAWVMLILTFFFAFDAEEE